MIKELQVNAFRNLKNVQLNSLAKVNLFYGVNGSGKTSLLESIYCLSLGRSFRTNQSKNLIMSGTDHYSLFSIVNSENNEGLYRIGFERDIKGSKKIRINGESVLQISSLAQSIPVQLMSTESYRFFYDGSKRRRQYLDIGMFHVEPLFLPLWHRFQHVLKQRNASLKHKRPKNEILLWDNEFCELAAQLHAYRNTYIENLRPLLSQLLSSMLNISLELKYKPGWKASEDLHQLLADNFDQDRRFGYTKLGPQRADLQLVYDNLPAQEYLSQGQLKTASYALHLAQGRLLKLSTNKSPIYLIDDLPSELDSDKQKSIIKILLELGSQVFVTAINEQDMDLFKQGDDINLFHVEHGAITPKVNIIETDCS